MSYPSAKGFIIAIALSFLLIVTIRTFIDHVYVLSVILILVTAYLVWMWFDTYYVIEGGKLYYTSALLKGAIDINTIKEIRKSKKGFVGIKASLSIKGIVVKYNKWDDIFLSPKNADQFIDALKAVNSEIKVVE